VELTINDTIMILVPWLFKVYRKILKL